jgi:hypothetical protein
VESRIFPQFFGKQVEVANDRHKQIVEIVRYTANKLTQRLDFLCLQQCRLSPLATGNFLPKLTVRPLKLSRPLTHQPLELHGDPALCFKVRASFILPSSSALGGNDSKSV